MTDEEVYRMRAMAENEAIVSSLQMAIISGPRSINSIRINVAEMIRRQAWKERLHEALGIITARDFIEFIHAPLPKGLDTDVPTIKRLLHDHPEELSLFVQAIDVGRGGANNPVGLGGKSGKTQAEGVEASTAGDANIVKHDPIMLDNVGESEVTVEQQPEPPVATIVPPKPPKAAQGTSTEYHIRRLHDLIEKQRQESPNADLVPAEVALNRAKAGEVTFKEAAREVGIIPSREEERYREAQRAFQAMTGERQQAFLAWCSANAKQS